MYCMKCRKTVPCEHVPDPKNYNGFEEAKPNDRTT